MNRNLLNSLYERPQRDYQFTRNYSPTRIQSSLPMKNYQPVQEQRLLPEKQVRYSYTSKYSKYLPKEVSSTLGQKDQLLGEFKKKCEENKERVEKDVDECLRDIILVFEEHKQRLFTRIDDHQIGFQNLFDSLEKQSKEIAEWSEDKMAEVDKVVDM